MATFTYSVFDADPTQSGPCAWPSRENREIEAARAADALTTVIPDVLEEARVCGQYASGDTLWITVWDEDDVIVAQDRLEVQS
jgi:hypothetical protein